MHNTIENPDGIGPVIMSFDVFFVFAWIKFEGIVDLMMVYETWCHCNDYISIYIRAT